MSTGSYWQVGKSLAETNKHMLESQLGADVAFDVGEQVTTDGRKRFHAHKYILVSRSPVFETMFYGSVAETGEVIPIPDIHPMAFQILMDFMYSEECHLDDIETAVSTVYASKKYMMSQLTQAAIKYILDHITTDNVCHVLEHCKGLDEDHVVSRCYDYIGQHAALIVTKDTFAALSDTSLMNILQSDSLYVLEEELFEAVIEWGRKGILREKKRVEEDQLHLKIKDFLKEIRFPLISYAKLTELNNKYGFLTTSDMHHVFEFQSGKIYPSQCRYNTKLRGSRNATRFTLSDDYEIFSLVRKDETVKRKFYLEFRPVKPTITIFALSLMNGPYLVRILVFDPNSQLVSYTQRDFTSWPNEECCKEMTIALQEPVECILSDEPYKIEVYLSKSNAMYWYDNVILGKFNGNQDLKMKFFNPEIISKLHYFA